MSLRSAHTHASSDAPSSPRGGGGLVMGSRTAPNANSRGGDGDRGREDRGDRAGVESGSTGSFVSRSAGTPKRPAITVLADYGAANPADALSHVAHAGAPPASPNPSIYATTNLHLPRTASHDLGASGLAGLGGRHRGKGMSFEEVQQGGILSAEERSHEFEGMELDEKSVGRMVKKLRPYYAHLAQIAEHYEEVDALLSGSLPYTVATSFHPSGSDAHTHPQLNGDGDAHSHSNNTGVRAFSHTRLSDLDEEDTEGWLRRNSTWRVRKVRRESKNSAASGSGSGSGSGRNGRGVSADREGYSRSASVERGKRGGAKERDVEAQAGGEHGAEAEATEQTGLLSRGKEREASKERLAKIALNVNTVVNVLLVLAKVVAVLYSSSISLTASLVDSALDLLSTFIILGTSWAMGVQTDRHKYPAGKRRFEPLGVLIFSVVMIASFVQVFIEAFQRAIKPEGEVPFDLSLVGASTMVATIGIKAIMWVWCSKIPSSGVQALAQDAENDVMLNIISLSFPSLGTFLGWSLLDPIGGMLLSAYIVIEWIKTLLENFENLSGKSASSDQVTRVLYLVTRFNPVVEIADVECYHIGDDLIVEVDVILPRGSTLHFAHDVGETIQCCLESLEGVLRAYVHVDYSSANPAQHTSRTPTTATSNTLSGFTPLNRALPPSASAAVADAKLSEESDGHESGDDDHEGSRGRARGKGNARVKLDGITEGVAR